MLIPRRVAAYLGQLLLCLEFLEHLHLSLKLVLLSMPYGRLQRQFVTFSMDKKSVFNELRIMCNAPLMLWSSWFKFLLMEVHRRCVTNRDVCVTCHTSVTDFRPKSGNPVEVTLMTSPKLYIVSHTKGITSLSFNIDYDTTSLRF